MSNSAELVQDYWLTLPADCRLAALAVTIYLPGISAFAVTAAAE